MEKICHEKISYNVPKAELHIHIEGTLEPELVIELAKRHKITQFGSVDELKQRYQFTCLRDFLELYYECCAILIHEEDFEALMYNYLKKASSQGLRYAEIFFDPQTHLQRKIPFSTVINGLIKGLSKGKSEFNVEGKLIMCFLRDLSEESAIEVFNESLKFKDKFIGVGLDSNEIDNPPEKFKNVFTLAKKEGFRLVAHAGEEECIPKEYMENAIDVLKAERIDHGVQIIKNKELMKRVIQNSIPLTVCPLSNVRLKVMSNLSDSPLYKYHKEGVIVCINSDDPAYFGGYIGDNYFHTGVAFNFSEKDYKDFALASFKATFLDDKKKEKYYEEVKMFFENYNKN